jgi:predicted DNA binding CopG/RHH family protein
LEQQKNLSLKKIPKFKADEEAVKFWESHSFQDYYKETKGAGIKLVKRAKRTVALRLDPDDIKSVEKIAERMGLSYTSLLRMWIKEHLNREQRA